MENETQSSKEFQNQFADEPETFHDSKPVKQNPFYLYGLIALLCLIAVGMFALRRMAPIAPKATDQASLSPTKVPVEPTAQPTADDTATWKTFESPEMGFSIKYPQYYLPKEETDLGPNDQRVNFMAESGDVGFYNFSGFSIHVSKGTLPEFPYDEKPTGGYTLGGLNGIYLELPKGYADGAGVTTPFSVVYVEKSGKLYQVQFNGVSNLKDQTITQILSTFKFTDEKAKTSSTPSGFTSYKNTALQYSLTLPSTWRAYDQVSGSAAKPTSDIVDIMDINRPASTPYPSGVIEITTYSSMVNAYASWQHSTKTINDIVVQVYENENETASVYLFPQPNRDSFIQLKFNGSKESSYYPGFVQIASSFKFTGPLNP